MKTLCTFFAVAYAWTWACWWTTLAIGPGRASDTLATLGQFGPFLGAVVAASLEGRGAVRRVFQSFLIWRVHPVWLVVCLTLLPATMLAAILIATRTTRIELTHPWTTLVPHFFYNLVVGGALGEEPGWRGYALPRLQERWGSIWGSVVLGLLGAGWHLPLWWIRPAPAPYWLFVIGAVLLTFIFTWVYNRTRGSVLYALLLHASLSTASVRLPDVPAFGTWVLILMALVLIGVVIGSAPRRDE